MSDDYEYDGQPDQCHECDQPAVGWDGSSGAMLCAAHYKRTSTPKATEYAGPNTVDEAKAFHEGFKAGAIAYASAIRHPTTAPQNETLTSLIHDSGWRCIEQFEKLTGRTV